MAFGNVFDSRNYSADATPFIEIIHDLAGSAAYVTGGVDPTLKTALDLPQEPFLVEGVNQDGLADRCAYDYANKKLLLYDANGTQKANASDQSGLTFRLRILCAKN